MEQVIIAPAGSLSACLYADLPERILLDEAECKASNNGQIGWGMRTANPAVILTKGDVETPVQTVFDAPMVPCRLCEPLGVTG